MGTKRVGLARTQALIENLKRSLTMTDSEISCKKITLANGVKVTAGGLDVEDGNTTLQACSFGSKTGLKITSATAQTATIAVTNGVNVDISVTQPAGTSIKHLICTPAGDIVTAGADGDDFDINVGTSAGGGQLIASTALMDDGGSAVTWKAFTPLYVIENSHGHAANQFVAGVGPFGGPATTEAITPIASLYSAAERTVHIRFKALANDLATAATKIRVVAVFEFQSH